MCKYSHLSFRNWLRVARVIEQRFLMLHCYVVLKSVILCHSLIIWRLIFYNWCWNKVTLNWGLNAINIILWLKWIRIAFIFFGYWCHLWWPSFLFKHLWEIPTWPLLNQSSINATLSWLFKVLMFIRHGMEAWWVFKYQRRRSLWRALVLR